MTEFIRAAGLPNKKSEGWFRSASPDSVSSKPLKSSKSNEDIVHGITTAKSESVQKCFSAMKSTPFKATVKEIEERIYRSNKFEPLGRAKFSGNPLPDGSHVYGKAAKSDGSAAEVFKALPSEAHEAHELYKRTHHDYDPGERLNRQYMWPSNVGSDFTFGTREERSEPASLALNWGYHEGKEVTERLSSVPIPDERVFGVRKTVASSEGASAAKCIHENYKSIAELLPDPTIGRSLPLAKKNHYSIYEVTVRWLH